MLLFALKFLAWYITRSVAILTDALESTVNVIAGFISLYGLYLASKPRDLNHPYGHGKAEFISAGVEGSMILLAGLVIIYESIINFVYPRPLHQLDLGMLLVSVTAVVNFIVGLYCLRQGKKNQSAALQASGHHLISDTYSTLGIVGGLILLYITKLPWLDSAVAVLFACFIIYTGYKILRGSLAGIMDEADQALLQQVVDLLNASRRPNWIDLHNLRIIKYGSVLHLDCHLTLPWYLNVKQAHEEVELFSQLVRKAFGESVELFVHVDGCEPFSCPLCDKFDCPVRQYSFQHKIPWTIANMSNNNKHQMES